MPLPRMQRFRLGFPKQWPRNLRVHLEPWRKLLASQKALAFDMSTTLTGLAGDVASFYNLSQDEAYTKLKSVFTVRQRHLRTWVL